MRNLIPVSILLNCFQIDVWGLSKLDFEDLENHENPKLGMEQAPFGRKRFFFLSPVSCLINIPIPASKGIQILKQICLDQKCFYQREGGERLIEVPVCDGCTGVVHEHRRVAVVVVVVVVVLVVVLVARAGPGTLPFEVCMRTYCIQQ